MKGQSFAILFHPKTASIDKNGNAMIYLRITVNGQRSETSIKRRIHPSRWNTSKGQTVGKSHEEMDLNRYMSIIRSKIYKIHESLVIEDKPFTAWTIKNLYQNKGKTHKTLLKVFQNHNEQIEKLVGKDYSYGCYRRYVRTKDHLADFIKDELSNDDIFLNEIDLNFITSFEYFLKEKNIGNHNTVTKYITNLKKIVRIAHANNWIKKDPFLNWKAKWKSVEREILNERELQLLLDKEISIARLDQVRDIFLFCCFTGLAYVDVKKLTKSDISLAVDGERWIKTKRAKTDALSSIPLLPIAEKILTKYASHSNNIDEERLLPVISNQNMNAYLKEIATLCDIEKNLTFHLARHTFATTVTLSNGVPIESVSKMLGHKSLKTTQIYAKVLDSKVRNDMLVIKNKYGSTQKTGSNSNLKIVTE